MDSNWEDYLYPGTTILRNKFGIRDREELRLVEQTESAMRYTELQLGVVDVDVSHVSSALQAIHYHLFQDIYTWAGAFRSVNISKEGHWFGDYASIGMYIWSCTRARDLT